MLRFFRNIRKGLLKDYKVAKYLTYAIGEIVLVVLGILIALQFNNWNESRKNREKVENIMDLVSDEITENLLICDKVFYGNMEYSKNLDIQANFGYDSLIKTYDLPRLNRLLWIPTFTTGKMGFELNEYEKLKQYSEELPEKYQSIFEKLKDAYEHGLDAVDDGSFEARNAGIEAKKRIAFRDDISWAYEQDSTLLVNYLTKTEYRNIAYNTKDALNFVQGAHVKFAFRLLELQSTLEDAGFEVNKSEKKIDSNYFGTYKMLESNSNNSPIMDWQLVRTQDSIYGDFGELQLRLYQLDEKNFISEFGTYMFLTKSNDTLYISGINWKAYKVK